MYIPEDMMRCVFEKLDNVADKVRFAMCNKYMLGLFGKSLVPVTTHQKCIKAVCDMIAHVAQYPAYKISYSFCYKWNVLTEDEDSFNLIIEKKRKNILGSMTKIEDKKYLKSAEIKSERLMREFVTNVLPFVLSQDGKHRVNFSCQHDYKRKKINMVEWPEA